MAKEDKNTAIYIAYDDYEPADSALPERNLLRAILVGALADLKRLGDDKRRAMEFFLSPEDDYIFSFLSICYHLNLDADRVLMVTGLKGNESANESVSTESSEPKTQLFEQEFLDS